MRERENISSPKVRAAFCTEIAQLLSYIPRKKTAARLVIEALSDVIMKSDFC